MNFVQVVRALGPVDVRAVSQDGLQALPLAAYFLPSPFLWLAGIVPTFWPAVVVWRALAGQPVLLPLLLGFAVNGLWLGLLVRRYRTSLLAG